MKSRFLIATALLLISAVACSKDDGFDPEGTVTLNMLDADNGRTFLGDMNVWIDNAMNFTCADCRMAEIGPVGGLSAIDRPVMTNLASRAAVREGYGYAVYRNRDIHRFPSGNFALLAGSGYYRMKVESLITRDGAGSQSKAPIGASVKYASAAADLYSLPVPEAMTVDMGSAYSCRIMDLNARDFDEMYIDEPFTVTEAESGGVGIRIERSLSVSHGGREYMLYLRKKQSWSYVRLTVLW